MRAFLVLSLLVLLTVLAAPPPPVRANGRIPEFIPIGALATGDDFGSVPFAISGDGNVVVGETTSSNGREAFRWTRAGGMVGIGDLAGGAFSSGAHAVDTDGSVIVGSSQSTDSAPTGNEAFRWTEAGGMVGLGDLPGSFYASSALGCSGDGGLVAGQSSSMVSLFQAMRWTSGGGIEALSDLAGGTYDCVASAVSRDGTTIIGRGRGSDGQRAVTWTGSTSAVPIGTFTVGVPNPGSNALGCSSDATWIVGIAKTTQGDRAVRWDSNRAISTLGGLGGPNDLTSYSIAYACSADGSVIVGSIATATGPEAFVWTEADGMQRVTDVLADLGVIGLTGWQLHWARGVSDDGKVITGTGINPDGKEEGWVAILGDPPELEPTGLFIRKAKVKVKTQRLEKSIAKVGGQIDLGVFPKLDLTRPVKITVGTLVLTTGPLTASGNGRAFIYKGNGIKLKVTRNPKGTSAAKFSLNYKGDLMGQVPPEGELRYEMDADWIIASGAVDLDGGKYAWNRRSGPGKQMEPGVHMLTAVVKLGDTSAKSLDVLSCLGPGGTVPVDAPDVTVEFRGWKATVAGNRLQRQPWGFSFVGDENGLTELALDYTLKEALSFRAEGVDLGSFAVGPNNIQIRLTVGKTDREMTVRVVRVGKKVVY